jgi:hypothetical protein
LWHRITVSCHLKKALRDSHWQCGSPPWRQTLWQTGLPPDCSNLDGRLWSIHHIVQTSPPVVSMCSVYWRSSWQSRGSFPMTTRKLLFGGDSMLNWLNSATAALGQMPEWRWSNILNNAAYILILLYVYYCGWKK